jgi:hypothetical protein
MHFMLFGQGWNEVFGHSAKAGLTAHVAAVKNFCHKKLGIFPMIVAKSRRAAMNAAGQWRQKFSHIHTINAISMLTTKQRVKRPASTP